MLKMMIVGATSAMAYETARFFAADGASFFLVGRNAEKLEAIASDLKVRGAKQAEIHVHDATNFDEHEGLVQAAIEAMGGFDSVLIAHGTLTDQEKAQADWDYALQEFNINGLSVISLLHHIANHFEKQKRGSIAVISSVAGDRGRMSNYVYGTAKATVTTFLEGLRARLDKSGVHVLTVKPGFVDTPMTADVKKNFLFASPAKVGEDIYNAMKKERNVIYTPWFWMFIMLIIRHIPERIFKKTSM